MSLDNHYYNLESDLKIKIKYKFSTVFHFSSELEIAFVIYLSNIGGLFGLWFGLSFIDVFSTIKTILNYLSIKLKIEYLISLVKLYLSSSWIKYCIDNLTIVIRSCKRLIKRNDLKLFLTMLTLPLVVIQIKQIIENYLQFSTQVSVDLIRYRNIENEIPVGLTPALTFCSEFLFDKVLFNQYNLRYLGLISNDQDKVQAKMDMVKSKTTDVKIVINVILSQFDVYLNDPDGESREVYLELNETHFERKSILYDHVQSILNFSKEVDYYKKMDLIHNKNISGFNATLIDLEIFNTFIKYEDKDRNIWKNVITPFEPCLTFIKESDSETNPTEKYVHDRFILKNKYNFQVDFNLLKYYSYKFFLHPRDAFPLLTSDEIYLTEKRGNGEDSFVVRLSRYEFERLPKPYETNCHNYGNSNRFQCLNDCYFNAYMNQIKCIPNYNCLLTIDLSRILPKARNPKERNPKERKIKARTHKSGTHKSEPKRAESKRAKSPFGIVFLQLMRLFFYLSCIF